MYKNFDNKFLESNVQFLSKRANELSREAICVEYGDLVKTMTGDKIDREAMRLNKNMYKFKKAAF